MEKDRIARLAPPPRSTHGRHRATVGVRPAAKTSFRLAPAALAACACLCGLADSLEKAYAGPGDEIERPRGELGIVNSYSIPIAEVSALARVRSLATGAGKSSGGVDLYAVGDASHEVVRFRIGGPADEPDIQVRDIAHLLGRHENNAS